MTQAEKKVTVSPVRLEAAGLHYRELNARLREAVKEGARAIDVAGVNGQRYIAGGLSGDGRLDIYGVPGNDRALLQGHLQDFCAEFGLAVAPVLEEPFWRLRPASHRPYGSTYAP